MRFPFTRRQVLGLIGGVAALRAGAFAAMSPVPTKRDEPTSAIGAFLDTLLPEDSTPSATQLGVDKSLGTRARPGSRLARLIDAGSEWLDKQAGQRGKVAFLQLDEAAREEVVRLAESSPPGSLPNKFFRAIRDASFRHYYANAAAWNGLGYRGPPQPGGFPDFSEPPDVTP